MIPNPNIATPIQQLRWQITLIDSLLATTRLIWLGAASADQRSKAWGQIDILLDRRLEYMRERDQIAAAGAHP